MEKPLQVHGKSPWPLATVQLRAPLSVMGCNSMRGLSSDGSAGRTTNLLTLWRLTLALMCVIAHQNKWKTEFHASAYA